MTSLQSRARRTAGRGGPAREEGLAVGGALRALAVVGPPITIATGLLFYFGWAVTAEQARAMGVDESVFVMSTRDYLLRSISALFVPLVVGSALVLSWAVLHGWLVDLAGRRATGGHVRRLGGLLAWTGWWAVPSLGWLTGALVLGRGELVVPLSVAGGFLVTQYGTSLRALAGLVAGRRTPSRPAWVLRLRQVLIGVLVTAALFWAVADYAGIVGRGKAALVATEIVQYPSVRIYAQHDLHVELDGVASAVLTGGEDDYRFVYTGFRLLQRSGDRFFLVPPAWQPGLAPVLVLRDDPSMRIELMGGV